MKKYEIFTFYNIYICIGDGDWGEWSEATCQKGVKLCGRGCYRPSQLYQGRPCQGSNVDEMFSDDDCTKKYLEIFDYINVVLYYVRLC